MTARRSKPSFASLLRRASEPPEPEPVAAPIPPGSGSAFHVDPARVRLWNGLHAPTPEECSDEIAAIVRDGQVEPVTVRPVFDDELYEYEVIAGARDYVAVRHLREAAIPALELIVQVELVDDAGAEQLAAGDGHALPDAMMAAFAGDFVPAGVAIDLAARLDGPLAPALLATAGQIARAQVARLGDGLPPYPAGEVMRLLDAVTEDEAEAPPAAALSLSIVDASTGSVTLTLDADEELTPEMLARIVKAMIDGAAADGMSVTWATAPTAATSP